MTDCGLQTHLELLDAHFCSRPVQQTDFYKAPGGLYSGESFRSDDLEVTDISLLFPSLLIVSLFFFA